MAVNSEYSAFNPRTGVKTRGDVGAAAVLSVNLVKYSAIVPAASANGAHAALALAAGAQAGVATGITNPVVPRNVTIVGNTAGIVGNVVIHGTNVAGAVITETLVANATTTVVGNKAFKTITSIDYPAFTNNTSDTIAVGFGSKLGINHRLSRNSVLPGTTFLNNVREGTDPTVAVSATLIENNTVTLNSALNGTLVEFIYAVP